MAFRDTINKIGNLKKHISHKPFHRINFRKGCMSVIIVTANKIRANKAN